VFVNLFKITVTVTEISIDCNIVTEKITVTETVTEKPEKW